MEPLHFCTYEDRRKNWVGLKILILSFGEHMEAHHFHLVLPEVPAELNRWLAYHAPWVHVHRFAPEAEGWAVKAEVLLFLLEDVKLPSVTWLDADQMIIREFSELFVGHSSDKLCISQCFCNKRGDEASFASIWGDSPERDFPVLLNTSILKVSDYHTKVLKVWRDRCVSDKFTNVQGKPVKLRDYALSSDQQILQGLLMSGRFSGDNGIDVFIIEKGKHLVHDHHYYTITSGERLRLGLRLWNPYFVHCAASKPWFLPDSKLVPYIQLKPYVVLAARYRDRLEEDVAYWMDYRTPFGQLCKAATLNNPHLQGLGLWFRDRVQRLLNR